MKPYLFRISGYKNSGKTELIRKTVSLLSESGIKTGCIKHDGHDFEPDREGTDSYAFLKHGALKTAVFSDHTFQFSSKDPYSFEAILKLFTDVDLVLIEGMKDRDIPGIFLSRDYRMNPSPEELKDYLIKELQLERKVEKE